MATRIFASDVARTFRVGERSVTGFDFFLSFALFAVGHLVGLWVGLAMLAGALIAWVWGVPHYSALVSGDGGTLAHLAQGVWSHQVRFIGAGAIGASAVWTLAKLVKPVTAGLRSALAASKARASGGGALLPRTEQDIPIGWVALISLVCMVPIGILLTNLGVQSGLGGQLLLVVTGAVIYIVLMGFFVSAVCGYMAGLIGASNSPLSGIGILAVIGAALLLLLGVNTMPAAGPQALVAYALFITSVVFAVATIANNNLQDLKTGQLVDATPWKQQVALVIGVLAGAAIIPPILDLVNHAYGFAGAPGPVREHPLPAPQAGLISALAQGVIQHNVDWSLIRIGMMIGVITIVVDETLRRVTKSAHLSPLAVGLGIYLPTQSTLMVVVGAVAGWLYDRNAARTARPDATKQLGVLLASGMIVGEGLVGVVIAAFVAFSGKDFPLGLVGDEFAGRPAELIGGGVFALVVYLLYRWASRLNGQAASAT